MTTLTLSEILEKIQNGSATAQEIAQLAPLYAQEQEEKKKAQDKFNKLIEDIKKAKVDPAVLFAKLVEEKLISAPSQSVEKVNLAIDEVRTANGQKSKFKIWKGRELSKLQGDAKGYWLSIKKKGEDHFRTILTDDGRAYVETDEGKEWLANLFAK